jgi:hypothetical protein
VVYQNGVNEVIINEMECLVYYRMFPGGGTSRCLGAVAPGLMLFNETKGCRIDPSFEDSNDGPERLPISLPPL